MRFDSLPSSQQKEINEILEKFGLGQKDCAAYLALLELGQTTVGPLARAINVPVTTAQSVVSRLIKSGLVDVSNNKSRHLYEAHDPVIMKRILERSLQEIGQTIPLLQSLKAEKTGNSKIRVYYRERATDIFHEALGAKDKMVYEIVSARDLQDVLGEKFHFTRRRVTGRVNLKSLRVEAHEIKKYSESAHRRELREAKFLPREFTFRASVMFWDNTVAFFTPKNEGVAWTVQSVAMREMFRQLFDVLWSVSRRMETAKEN
jgi:sugar-specific transcriptional regulator TrmB